MIEQARPNAAYAVHLTYPAEHCDAQHAEWLRVRGRTFDPAQDSIAPIIQGWRAGGLITVKEGPVEISLP
jgi:hypothetical protein